MQADQGAKTKEGDAGAVDEESEEDEDDMGGEAAAMKGQSRLFFEN